MSIRMSRRMMNGYGYVGGRRLVEGVCCYRPLFLPWFLPPFAVIYLSIYLMVMWSCDLGWEIFDGVVLCEDFASEWMHAFYVCVYGLS